MTTKEKAYDEALERARDYYKANLKLDKADENLVLEDIFPELAESEDEKIRKEIMQLIQCMHDADPRKERWIAWLGKQGEQKETLCDKCKKEQPFHSCQDITALGRCAIEKQDEQKPIDKIEPKFKVGDWIVNKGHSYLIADIDYSEQRYLFEIGGYTHEQLNWEYIEIADKRYHLWTIQDAKDGDILAWDDSKCIAIFKNIYDEDSFNSHGFVGHFTGVFESRLSYHDIEGVHPAIKEQRDLLFQKMHEAGYEWNANKAEPKFHEGDWIVQENIGVYKVIEVCESWYEVIDIEDNHYSISFDKEYMCHIWSIKDAKDGDVLAGKIDGDNYILIFKKVKDGWVETYGHYYDSVERFCVSSQLFCRDYQGSFTPATKEQCDLLLAKMGEAGYELDEGSKELKLLITNGGDFE